MSETERKEFEKEFADYYEKEWKDASVPLDYTNGEAVWLAARSFDKNV